MGIGRDADTRDSSCVMSRKRTSAQDAVLVASDASEDRFPWRTDQFLETYVCWREECELVKLAYESWRGSSAKDQKLAFAAYYAALDREQQAARLLAAASERIDAPVG
ncbi:MAG: hypothetical protein JWN32_2470 [Solirubrobacterales bacterium]|nr:hypothetical protein [Solirubrobacterales bacterium]